MNLSIRSPRAACGLLALLAALVFALAGPAGARAASAPAITTVAGNGVGGFSGDNGSATSAEINGPNAVAVDASGNLFIADQNNSVVREVHASTGVITTVAGNGTPGFSGDNGSATSAELNYPAGVAVDANGNLFIADTSNNRVREVHAATGIITTVAGNGTNGFSGDGGPATSAKLGDPTGVAVDANGNLYIADYDNNSVREVHAGTGIITTVAGDGTGAYNFSGDGGPATGAELADPAAVAVDASGNLFIADAGNERVREVNAATGIITTVAGDGTNGFSGDNGTATNAELNYPTGVAVDASGNLFIADDSNSRVREVNAATGIITTVAGNGTYGFSGDGGPATSAELGEPSGVAVDANGSLFIADYDTNYIREVSTPPPPPTLTAPASGTHTNNTTPTLQADAEAGDSVTFIVDGTPVGTATADANGQASFTLSTPLGDGQHTVTATATDASGNASAPSTADTFTVDTVAPAAPTVAVSPLTGPVTSDNTPTITITGEAGATARVSIDGTQVGTTSLSGGTGTVASPQLSDGVHTVTATATDEAGNVSAASTADTFTVDTVAPDAPNVTAPADGSFINDTTPTVKVDAEAGSTVTFRVDGQAVGTSTAASGRASLLLPTPLAEGQHTVTATATDAAGNTSAASTADTFTVDTTAPDAPTLTSPASGALTGSNTPTLQADGEAGSTVAFRVDGQAVGSATANASGHASYTPTTALADGQHTVTVTATDAAGNTSAPSAAVSFTVDTTPPAAPAITTPANGSATNNNEPTLKADAEAGSTVVFTLDGQAVGTATAVAGGHASFPLPTPLPDGQHTVSATATDAAGNVSAVSSADTFTVDTKAPDAPTITAPTDGSYTNDSSPGISITGEASATAHVSIDGSDAGTVTLDNGGRGVFTPADKLADGQHTVTVTLSDAAGNTSAASSAVHLTVDTQAPSAPHGVAPTGGSSINNSTPTLTADAAPGDTVTFIIDGSPAGTATADASGHASFTPKTPLGDGQHTVTATATDAAGNVSAASTAYTFTVDTAKLMPTPTNPTPTPTNPAPPAQPKPVGQMSGVGHPSPQRLLSRGEKVRVYCRQACSLNVELQVYYRAIARGQHHRSLLAHSASVMQPWMRVTVGHATVKLAHAGYKTVVVKVTAHKQQVKYAGGILLGVYIHNGRELVGKKWMHVKGRNVSKMVRALNRER